MKCHIKVIPDKNIVEVACTVDRILFDKCGFIACWINCFDCFNDEKGESNRARKDKDLVMNVIHGLASTNLDNCIKLINFLFCFVELE